MAGRPCDIPCSQDLRTFSSRLCLTHFVDFVAAVENLPKRRVPKRNPESTSAKQAPEVTGDPDEPIQKQL